MILWRFFTNPSSSIKDTEQYRDARLLSIFSLLLIIIFLGYMVISAIDVEDYRVPPADLIGYGVLILIYLLSRTKYYRVGILIMTMLIPLNTFSNIFQGTTPNPANTINFLVFSYVFVGIFFSVFWTALYSFLVITVIALLPSLIPGLFTDFSSVIQLITVNTITAFLVLVFKNHRNDIERARQNEMKITYDNTLAGWSQALEFRDKETKGHSNRVTNLTIKLANRIGIVDEDTLQHIRRGALLHDIGKMSIPNTILLKKGPLTAEDWEIVYQHPTYAYQMLKDIPFLTPALDIPYSHHEKWDGSGYPRGLKGEAIPISARLFALADVWDALTSERSYRGAWTEEKAKTYIRDQAGIHFDPQLVPLFLQILEER